MLQSKKIELNDKWMQEFGFIDTEEYKHYNKIIASVKEIKLKDFQFKVIDKILVYIELTKPTIIFVNIAIKKPKRYITFS